MIPAHALVPRHAPSAHARGGAGRSAGSSPRSRPARPSTCSRPWPASSGGRAIQDADARRARTGDLAGHAHAGGHRDDRAAAAHRREHPDRGLGTRASGPSPRRPRCAGHGTTRRDSPRATRGWPRRTGATPASGSGLPTSSSTRSRRSSPSRRSPSLRRSARGARRAGSWGARTGPDAGPPVRAAGPRPLVARPVVGVAPGGPVKPPQSRTIVAAAARAASLKRAAAQGVLDRALGSLRGIGPWTIAETRIRALGDADAVSVGDYHLAHHVGYALTGRRVDDAEMLRAPRAMGGAPSARHPPHLRRRRGRAAARRARPSRGPPRQMTAPGARSGP